MTDLALITPEPQYAPTDPTGGRLVAWAEGLAAAHRIGSALCQTSFVPSHFRGKPEEAAAAILYGDEIGFTPTQSVQNLYVISGKPALYARSMVALVLSKGHEVWTVEKSDAKVTVAGRRRGTSHVIEETWTPARATKAGYSNNKKYQTDPQAMLYARAASDVCRQVAPDALAGIAYSAEELDLEEPSETTTVRRSEPKRTAQRRQATPSAEPDLEPPTITADQPIPADDTSTDSITEPQIRALHASFNDAGVTERDARLAYCQNLIGRDLSSSKDLTKDEASRVIDALKQDSAGAAEESLWGVS